MALTVYQDADERAKLLHVRTQIENLLRAHDICGDVVLAGRGRVEVFTILDASWSCARLYELPDQGGHALRLRSKLADYKGDKDALRADLEWTTGMVSSLAQIKAQQGLSWLEATTYIDEQTGAEHTDLRPEPKQ